MTLLAYYLRTAGRNLRRGGQRVFVALLCIAFGVMSVVSMTLLSNAIEALLILEPAEMIGADVTMDRPEENSLLPETVAGLQALQQEGLIDRLTLVAYTSTLVYRLPGSGELHFPSAGLGIDPATYPLAGAFTTSEPASVGLETLISRPGDLLITRDLAAEDGLKPGDTLLISDRTVGAVVEGRIRGIVTDTPNHQGTKIYYTIETARLIAGTQYPENTALANSADPEALAAAARKLGWRATTADKMYADNAEVRQFISYSLKGAGILGLLVGGIGIANTMQVLLRRRRFEVAVLKTLGYRQGELQVQFAVEAALLGVVGSLLGAALGVAVSYGLVELFSRITNLLISWVFNALPVFTSLLVGVVTTISFALFAIVLTSQAPPLALLRREALQPARIPRLQALGLALLCALPFVAVTALVMGSLPAGLGVLLFALVGLAVLGGVLGGLVWLVTRLLPMRLWPLARMAQTNLKRRSFSSVFAMIALFTGVVALALGVVTSTSAQRALDARLIDFEGDNINIVAPAAQEAAIRQAIAAEGVVEHVATGYQTAVRSVLPIGFSDAPLDPVLIGRDEPGEYLIRGAEWGSVPNGVYLYGRREIPEDGQMEVTLMDGSVHRLPVVGSYDLDFESMRPFPQIGLLVPAALSRQLAPPDTIQVSLTVPAAEVNRVVETLGAALPQALVINLPAYAARYTQTYMNLFIFAVAMASLALLAGVLLVANSVSLAMLDRRYEIGVLKAVGYARWQLLFTLLVEYTLTALIATVAGLAAVQIFLIVMAMANDLAGSLLAMTPGAAVAILFSGVGLILLTVLAITWRPVQVSPVVVLNDRE